MNARARIPVLCVLCFVILAAVAALAPLVASGVIPFDIR